MSFQLVQKAENYGLAIEEIVRHPEWELPSVPEALNLLLSQQFEGDTPVRILTSDWLLVSLGGGSSYKLKVAKKFDRKNTVLVKERKPESEESGSRIYSRIDFCVDVVLSEYSKTPSPEFRFNSITEPPKFGSDLSQCKYWEAMVGKDYKLPSALTNQRAAMRLVIIPSDVLYGLPAIARPLAVNYEGPNSLQQLDIFISNAPHGFTARPGRNYDKCFDIWARNTGGADGTPDSDRTLYIEFLDAAKVFERYLKPAVIEQALSELRAQSKKR